MSEGARFQIVLVDETPPDSQTAKPDTGPSPPPFVPPPPAVSATTPTPQPKPTDRPAPLTDSATPVKERADRRPNDNEKSESQKDFDRVKKAAISLDDIIGTGGLVRKAVAMVDVARTVIEGLNAVKRLTDKPTAPQAVAESGALQEDPEGFANTLKEAIEKHTGTAKPDPKTKAPEAPPAQAPPVQKAPMTLEEWDAITTQTKPEAPPVQAPPVTATVKAPEAPPVQAPPVQAPPVTAKKPEAPPVQVPPVTATVKAPEAPPVQAPPVTAKKPEAPPVQAPPVTAKKPEAPPVQVPPAALSEDTKEYAGSIKELAGSIKEPAGSIKDPAGSIKEPLDRIAHNTNPANLDKQADKIVDGLQGDAQPKPESRPKAPEIQPVQAPKGGSKAPEKPDPRIPAPKIKPQAQTETVTKGVQTEVAAARAVATTEATAGAAVATEATAVAATETAAALGEVAAVSSGAVASLGAVAVAAAPVAIALVAVGAAAYKMVEVFKQVWNTAREQQQDLVSYSDAIAIQQAETQVRREMRMVERANELGDRLARVGEAQDRNDEAWQKLSDAIDDILIRNLETILPLIEVVTAGVNQVAEGVELANATGQLINATLRDWLQLGGTEAEQDRAYYEAEALFKKKWDAFFTADQRSKEDSRFMNDPMLQALNNAWGQNKPIDPKDIANMVAQVRAL
jgi:hypothetical protein